MSPLRFVSSINRKFLRFVATPSQTHQLKLKVFAAIAPTEGFSPSINHLRTMATIGNYKLTEIEGDLFSAPNSHSLAHCVGADFAMAAGIAVKFKQVYGKVDVLRAQKIQSGGVAVLDDNDRYIYYLVTKPESWGSPTYDSLRSSLTAMREHMRSHEVNKLAIPRIGCGIDGLEWDKVSSELNEVFANEDLEIVVYNFVPK